MPAERVCCGLTWISTGQLGTAKKVLRRTVGLLAEHVRGGGLVLGLEPSCTAVFRSDAADLLPEDLDVARLRKQTVTLAELLREHTPGWTPPRLDGLTALAQVHCHQHAVLGWDADHDLLTDAGADAAAARVRVLRPGRQLRLRGRPPGRQRRLRRERAAAGGA